MSKLMHYYFNTESNEILALEKEDKANPNPHFTTVEELVASSVSTAAMLAWVNTDKPADKKLKGFRMRADGAARIFKELGHVTEDEQQAFQAEADKRAATAAEKEPKGRKKASGATEPTGDATASVPDHGSQPAQGSGRGRKSSNVDKRLFSAVQPDTTGEVINPRKVGSHGHKSMAILIAAGAEGISYSDFVAQGGRPQDLNWDIAHSSARAA